MRWRRQGHSHAPLQAAMTSSTSCCVRPPLMAWGSGERERGNYRTLFLILLRWVAWGSARKAQVRVLPSACNALSAAVPRRQSACVPAHGCSTWPCSAPAPWRRLPLLRAGRWTAQRAPDRRCTLHSRPAQLQGAGAGIIEVPARRRASARQRADLKQLVCSGACCSGPWRNQERSW